MAITNADLLLINPELSSLDTNVLDAAIETAGLLIDSAWENATITISGELKDKIQAYLSCHLLAMGPAKGLKSQKIDISTDEYLTIKVGLNLMATPYGQTVAMLDSTGLINNRGFKSASIYAVPKISHGEYVN